MASLKVPYFQWRNGRPRWEPGPALRRAGWKGRDLKDGKGGWLPLGDAIEAAAEINRGVTAWREGRAPGPEAPAAAAPRRQAVNPNARTVDRLFDLYFQSPDAARLADNTRYDYERHAARIRAAFGDFEVRDITRRRLKKFHHALAAGGRLALANAALRVFSVALSYAVRDLEWIPANPCTRLKLPGARPRLCRWEDGEIALLVRTADALGPLSPDYEAVADAVVLALHTGQRQGDVLALCDAHFAGGRYRGRIAKTGEEVDVKLTPQLLRRLKIIAARKKRRGIVSPRLVLLASGAKRPGYYFWRRWSEVRALAAWRHGRRVYRAARLGGAARPQAREQAAAAAAAFRAKRFLDLRDTAITRLGEAGCTTAEIAAISRHSLATIDQMLKHYLVHTRRQADNAIDKLTAHLDATGAEW